MHEQLSGILRSRLGQYHGDFLAVPRQHPDGSTTWTTALEGSVTPAAMLNEEERKLLQQRAERIVMDIVALAQQLAAEGGASAVTAEMLREAVHTPAGDWLYSVAGRPVLAMWGHGVAPDGSVEPGAPGLARSKTHQKDWPRWAPWAAVAALLLAVLPWVWPGLGARGGVDSGLAQEVARVEAANQQLAEELARQQTRPASLQCGPTEPAASAPSASAS